MTRPPLFIDMTPKKQIEHPVASQKLGDLEARLVIVERHIVGCEVLLKELREEHSDLVDQIKKQARGVRMAFTGNIDDKK